MGHNQLQIARQVLKSYTKCVGRQLIKWLLIISVIAIISAEIISPDHLDYAKRWNQTERFPINRFTVGNRWSITQLPPLWIIPMLLASNRRQNRWTKEWVAALCIGRKSIDCGWHRCLCMVWLNNRGEIRTNRYIECRTKWRKASKKYDARSRKEKKLNSSRKREKEMKKEENEERREKMIKTGTSIAKYFLPSSYIALRALVCSFIGYTT